MQHETEDEKIIRFPELQEMLGGVSRTTVWRWEKIGWLPKRIQLGPRSRGSKGSKGWKLTEIKAHIKNLKRV